MYNKCLHDCDLLTNNMMELLSKPESMQKDAKDVFAIHTTTVLIPQFAKLMTRMLSHGCIISFHEFSAEVVVSLLTALA